MKSSIKPFAECDFVVTFYGECPCSKLIHGWEQALLYIDRETGGDGDVTKGWYEQFNDVDAWSTLNHFYADNVDERHVWGSKEIDEGFHLRITRITE